VAQTDVALVDENEMILDRIGSEIDAEGSLRVHGRWLELGEAYDAWTSDAPRVAILDRRALGLDPIASLEAIRDTTRTRLLVRARRPKASFVHLMLDGGAHGVVEATTSAEETVDAVRSLVADGFFVPRALGRELQARRATGAAVPYLTLSRRERGVMALAVGGATAKEIGDQLHIALPTVRSHLKHAYEKLGVRGHREALFALIDLGVLDAEQVAGTDVSIAEAA
jgi:DNA-binding NarL/FixJ family response regulator